MPVVMDSYPPSFQYAVTHTLVAEGGDKLTNHKWDPGGRTKYGISQKAYPDLDIENLTEAEAIAIYFRDYWNALRLPEIKSKYVAAEIFDTAVLNGQGTATRIAQRACNMLRSPFKLKVDGDFGPATTQALNKLSERYELHLVVALNFSQGIRFMQIAQSNDELFKEVFTGWMKRLLPPKELLA